MSYLIAALGGCASQQILSDDGSPGQGLPYGACCRRVGFTSISGLFGQQPALLGRAMKRLMHCSKTAALNGSILVAPNLRHHLSGMAIIEELASDDVLDSAYE